MFSSPLAITNNNLTPVFSTIIGRCSIPITVYELKNSWPRYFLTSSIKIIDSPTSTDYQTTLNRIASTTLPTIYLSSNSISSSTRSTISGITNNAQNTDYTVLKPIYQNAIISFSTDSGPNGKLLFIGNTYLPRWHAFIDGTETPVLKANYLYMAIVIPPGPHKILFTYIQPSNIIDYLFGGTK